MKRLRLIANARRLWHRLWSVRLTLFAALLSATDVAFQFYATGQPSMIVIGSFLFSIGSAIARLVAQDSLTDAYASAP